MPISHRGKAVDSHTEAKLHSEGLNRSIQRSVSGLVLGSDRNKGRLVRVDLEKPELVGLGSTSAHWPTRPCPVWIAPAPPDL